MPGNEVGDRIHNFLGQDNWSQGQHQSQTADGTWSGLNNNPWAGSQRHIGTPLISNLKNDNVHQPADTERGGESSSVQLGMYFSHSNPGPEFARSQSQSQQPPLNGYMHGHQVLQTKQNEENFLGVDTESDRHIMTSKGFSMLDSQLGDGPEFLKKNSVRMDFNESPVNYDFFGGQQQISSQHPGMVQSFPRQQSGVSDMQLLQHQFMVKKMQEMQQELQKQEDARKLNKRVFNYMINNSFEFDQYMRNRVLLMHVKCGMMIDARRLFDEMPERNLVSWNTIISGLADVGDFMEAFRLFLIMWEEFSDAGSFTYAVMIRASAGLELISIGRQLHACTLKMGIGDDIFVSCALIDMYSKCGSIEDARFVFEEMPEKTTVGWNTIIAGYALHGYSEEALDMYYEMRDSGVRMDHFTFSMIVRICARLASVEHAKQAHAALIRHGFGSDIVANTALVDFYSKWGRIEDARHVFDKMTSKNVISWNALIGGYGNHGRGPEAVELFEQMLQERMNPNHVTFLAVLSACSHSGLSEHGWEIFHSMGRDNRIKPRAMHYACMIELLGREGLLDEALALIRGAPFKPTANMWAALLTACRVNENLELGKFAAEKLYGMEPDKLNNYVVLLNIYNSAGNLKEAADVVHTLKRKGLRMRPVCSWIEVKRRPHVFLSGDNRHPQRNEIYQKVDKLMLEISKYGYVPNQKTLLPDVDEQEERVRFYHSEKLAIAFGLISTPYWVPLQIVQGHRICGDCHEAIKLIARVTEREIVIRDASRFHHFKHGHCSCEDYW